MTEKSAPVELVEAPLPGAGEIPSDPEERQAHVTLQLFKLGEATGCPEAIEHAYRLGYRVGHITQLEAVRAAVDSVKGRYVHPDHLETAVCRAFERIAALVYSQPRKEPDPQ